MESSWQRDLADLAGPRPVTNLMSAAIVLGIAYGLLLRPIYNVFFHPLRSFPGPKLWAASTIPFTRMSLSGSAPMQVLQLHEKYGDVVRIRPNELSFIDAGAWKDLNGQKKGGQDENAKDPAIVSSPALRESILGADRETHARFRRALAPGFSSKAMLAQETLIQSYVDLLMRKLRQTCDGGSSGPVDLRSWFNFFTFDLIGDLSFGEPFDCLTNADYHPWVASIIRVMQALLFIGVVRRYLPWLDSIAPWITPKKVAEAQRRHGMLTREKVAKRLKLSTARPDFIDAMTTSTSSEDGQDPELTLAEIQSNASVLIVAGSETSATALTAAAYFLALYPHVLARLAEEVRSSFKTEADINLVGVGKLRYLTAVMEESLRLYPPAPWSQPRVIRRGGDIISGHFVPEGTIVGVWQWAASRSPKNFSQPDEFIPERWLGDARFRDDRTEASQPFSYGPRDCVGRNLAYAEIRLVLAKLVWNFDIRLDDSSKRWMQESKVYLVWKKPPLNMYLTPRRVE